MENDSSRLAEAAKADPQDSLQRILAASDQVDASGPHLTSEDLQSALGQACAAGRHQNVRLLLGRGVALTDLALLHAARAGSIETWKVLLETGLDPNRKVAVGSRRGTAPLIALVSNNIDIMRLLLDHGADVNATCGDGTNALDGAAQQASLEPARFLIERGVRAQPGVLCSALKVQVPAGIPMLELLIRAGADVNAKGPAGPTGFSGNMLQFVMCHTDKPEDVREQVALLIDAGADPTARATVKLDRDISALEMAQKMEPDFPGLYQMMVEKMGAFKGGK